MLPEPISPMLIRLAGLDTGKTLFRPGQTFQTLVRGNPGDLFIQVGGTRVPLESTQQLVPGQMVQVTVTEAEGEIRLNIEPRKTTAQQDLSGKNVSASLKALVGTLKMLDVEAAARLLPKSLPQNSPGTAQLLRLLFQPGNMGKDIEALVALLSGAVEKGIVPRAQVEALLQFSQLLAAEEKDWKRILKSWQKEQGMEGRLARLLDGGLKEFLEGHQERLLRQLMHLKGNKDLQVFLKQQKQLQVFNQRFNQLNERFAGNQLQNLWGDERMYLFMEIPISQNSGFERAHLHLLGEPRSRRITKDNATVLLDLSTRAMGEMWVALKITSGKCHCDLRVTREPVCQQIEADKAELIAGLEAAGYTAPVVRVHPWDGDRVRELVNLANQFNGVDFSV